jgi:hypothetical protein
MVWAETRVAPNERDENEGTGTVSPAKELHIYLEGNVIH